jgi:cytochrome d ubiquinol oxidase subunit I
MLTPRPAFNLPLILMNPTEIPLEMHRFVGNIAFAGAMVALVAGIRLLWRSRQQLHRAYLDWMGHYGLMWAVGFTIAQPLVGWEYAKEIQLHAYASWYEMMLGGLSVAFLFQVFLLGAIFTVGIFYLWRRVRVSGFRSPALAVCTALSFAANANVPIWQGGLLIPWGQMIPWKLTALIVFTGVAITAITVYAVHLSRGRLHWGDAGRGQAISLITVGVAISLIMALMGYIREDSRGPFLITNHMLINQQQNYTPPSTSGPALNGPASNLGAMAPTRTGP